MSPATVNRIIRHLKAIFNQGIKQKLFTGKNPVSEVSQFRLPKTIPTYLTDEEIEKILTASKAHSRAAHWVALLGIYLGLRKNEIANVSWEWFDFDKKLVTVKMSSTFQLKDAEERVIPINDKLHVELFPFR